MQSKEYRMRDLLFPPIHATSQTPGQQADTFNILKREEESKEIQAIT